MIREVEGCGARVVLAVQLNHIKKKNLMENKNKFSKLQDSPVIDYILVFTRYKKITLFISGKKFHLARLSSQTEQRTRIISPT